MSPKYNDMVITNVPGFPPTLPYPETFHVVAKTTIDFIKFKKTKTYP
jgi:hypothetical protein